MRIDLNVGRFEEEERGIYHVKIPAHWVQEYMEEEDKYSVRDGYCELGVVDGLDVDGVMNEQEPAWTENEVYEAFSQPAPFFQYELSEKLCNRVMEVIKKFLLRLGVKLEGKDKICGCQPVLVASRRLNWQEAMDLAEYLIADDCWN